MNFSICRVQKRIIVCRNRSRNRWNVIKESQDGWGCKEPLEGVWSYSLLKQGHLEMSAQDHIQTAFEYVQGGKLSSSLGNLCQYSVTFTVEICAWCSDRASWVSFYAHCLLSCHQSPLDTGCLCPLCIVYLLYNWWDCPEPSLFQAEQPQLDQPLRKHEELPRPFITFECPEVASLVLSNTVTLFQ